MIMIAFVALILTVIMQQVFLQAAKDREASHYRAISEKARELTRSPLPSSEEAAPEL